MLRFRMRHRVKFEMPVESVDGNGFKAVTWQTATVGGVIMSSVPAEVLTGAGKELIAAGQKFADVTLRVNCRWFVGLSAKWRIVWEGRVYDIIGFEADRTARQEWRIRCVGGLTDGQ